MGLHFSDARCLLILGYNLKYPEALLKMGLDSSLHVYLETPMSSWLAKNKAGYLAFQDHLEFEWSRLTDLHLNWAALSLKKYIEAPDKSYQEPVLTRHSR